MAISDDFYVTNLSSAWEFDGGDGSFTSVTSSGGESYLELVTPEGNFDFWNGSQGAARVMQATVNENFVLSARFLSVPSERYQMQGFLIEGAAGNVIRIDTYSDGSTLHVFAAITAGGSSSIQLNVPLPVTAAPYLRVERVGDAFTVLYSVDGETFVSAGSFVHAMTVSEAGLFAGNTANSSGFTAQVDWFEIDSDPLLSEDGESTNAAPNAADDALTVALNAPTTILVADLLANDVDPEGVALSLVSITQPANGTLVNNGDETLTYTPTQGYTGTDSFTYTVSDGDAQASANVAITVGGPAIASDEFADLQLSDAWTFEGASGASYALGASGGNDYLELITPDGNFDLWGSKENAARLMQDAPNENFVLKVKFLSTPTQKFQMQGLLVEGQAGDWVRVDTYSDGNSLYIFAAVTVGGSSSVMINTAIPESTAPFLLLGRTGDTFTVSYSQDGANWTVAGSFDHAIVVTEAGLFAGNTGDAQGFTAQVDWFEVASDPLEGSNNTAPVAADDAVAVALDGALVIAVSDLLANDTDLEGDTLELVSFTQPQNGTLVENDDGTLTLIPGNGFSGADSFTYLVSDGSSTATATVSVMVGTPSLASDDFSGTDLDPSWSFSSADGASYSLLDNGTDQYISLSTPDGAFDLWGDERGAARLTQATANEDFALTARFLSTPSEKFQMQGLLVEGAAGDWIRVDTYSNGSSLKIFAAVTVNGSSSVMINDSIPGGVAPYLSLARQGDLWRASYSLDGVSWVEAGSFVHEITVTDAGVFAGNTGQADGFTAQVDWFEVNSDPLQTEDGAPHNIAPFAGDDALVLEGNTTTSIDVAALMANDSDANNDPLSFQSFTQPQNGILSDNGEGTLFYTPNTGFVGVDTFTYTIGDGVDTSTATVVITVEAAQVVMASVAPDDFDAPALGAAWTVGAVSGTSADLKSNAGQSILTLSTSGDDHRLWGQNLAAHATQSVADGNFSIIAKFLSDPSNEGEAQGLLMEADAANWLSVGVEATAAGTHLIAVITEGGVSSVMLSTAMPADDTSHIRVTREGDNFAVEVSADGASWVNAGGFSYAMTLSSVGVYAASVDGAYDAEVDYFFDALSPPATEDGAALNATPVAADDTLQTPTDSALVIATDDLLANDTDAEGNALSVVAFSAPEHGTLIDNGNGTFTYTPAAGFSGVDRFTYTVGDGTDVSDAEVSISVGEASGDGALFSDDFSSATLDEDWTFLGITGSASLQSDGGEAWLEIESPTGIAVDALGSLTTPRVLQDLEDEDFQVTVKFLNEPYQTFQEHGLLIVQDDQNWIRFDLAYTSSGLRLIVGEVVDGDGSIVLFKGVDTGEVSHLRITRTGDSYVFGSSADGETWSVAYTLQSNMAPTGVGPFAGSTSYDGNVPGFTTQVDWFETSASPLTLEDNAVPFANPDTIVGDQDTTLVIDAATLLANDRDGDGETLSIVSVTQPQDGTLTDNGNGTYTFVPDAGFSGLTTFTYTVSDGFAQQTAVATIGVNAQGNARTVATDDAITTAENQTVTIDVLANDTDADGPQPTIVSVEQGAFGAVSVDDSGNLVYTPDAGASGIDTFAYTIDDGAGGVDTATVTVTVTPVNDAPVAVDDAIAGPVGQPIVIAIADLIQNDTDGDGDTLTLVSFTAPLHGTLVDNQDGTLTYTPDAGYFGLDGFGYTITDGNEVAAATASISVVPEFGFVSDDFSGAIIDAGWHFDGPVGSATALQADGEGFLRIAMPSGTNDAWGVNNSARYMQYVQDQNFSLEAKFLSTPSERTHMQGILVEQDDQNWIRFDTLYNGTTTRAFAAVTRDGVSSEVLSVDITSADAAYLQVSRAGDAWMFLYSADRVTWTSAGTFVAALRVDEVGVFAATANKARALNVDVDYLKLTSDTLEDDVTVPNAPVANDDVLSTATGTPLVITAADLLGNDFDTNGDPLSLVSIEAVSGGTLVDNGNETHTFTPTAGLTGVAELGYVLSDGTDGPTATASVFIDIDNQAPAALDDAFTVTEDTSAILDILANDNDPNADVIRLISVSGFLNGTVEINPDGTVRYTANSNFFGTDTFTYIIGDGLLQSEATATVTVTGVDDAPVAVDDELFAKPGEARTIDVGTELFANDLELDGEGIALVGVARAQNGTVVDNSDGTLTYTPSAGFNGFDTFAYTVTDGTTDVAATVNLAVRDAIEVWYGDTQTFGTPGQSQEWINILGNVVSDNLVSLSYSLNGGVERSLSVGPDTRRLQDNGDFNIDLAYAELDPTSANDTITIFARYADGPVETSDVTVVYEDGAYWPNNYSIDWSAVTELQDAVQVVDGTWAVETDGSGVRPTDLGYDRLLVLGDEAWDNYEVQLSVTTHDLQNVDPLGRDGGGFAFGMLWGGHTDSPKAGWQPKSGWEPGASFFYVGDKFKLHSYHKFNEILNVQKNPLQENVTYEFLVRVEQVGLYDRQYSLKVWEEGTDEPAGWTITGIESFSLGERPATGSFYLNAHYYDVAFNDIAVTPIEGSDVIIGTRENDIVSGVNVADALPGVGETDTFVGDTGSDVFVFGDADKVYYDDGVAGSDGEGDLAFVWDFDPTEDAVELHGQSSDYALMDAPASVGVGTAIYRVNGPGDQELIAVLNTDQTLSLDDPEFVFLGDAFV